MNGWVMVVVGDGSDLRGSSGRWCSQMHARILWLLRRVLCPHQAGKVCFSRFAFGAELLL